jgi:murein DD-endopeptidase MepM/ murein hydrolase activator NlpD
MPALVKAGSPLLANSYEMPEQALKRVAPPDPIQDQLADATRLHAGGQLNDAIVALRAILAARPEHRQARHQLGLALVDAKRWEQGRDMLRQVVELQPDNAEAWNGLALCQSGEEMRPATREAARVKVDLNALIRRANLLAASFKEAADSLQSHRQRLAATPSIMPTQGWLSSAFSRMRAHPVLHISRPHEGIDVSAPQGAPIEAPANGTVIRAGWENGYGNVVEINHGFGIVTRFAHASKLLVSRGQRVSRGERVALVGSTGLATGPHLHYEVHVNGQPVDPLRYVLPEAIVD